MKLLIFALLVTFALCTQAQNGGQANENQALKLTYAGKIGSNYFAKIKSKQNCWTWNKVNYNGVFTEVHIAPNGESLFNLGSQPGSFTLRVKALTDCGCSDMGWVELQFNCLPLTFKSITFSRNKNDKNKGTVIFETTDVVNLSRFVVRLSIDGKTKIDIGTLFPDALQPNTTYVFPIDDLKAATKRCQNQ